MPKPHNPFLVKGYLSPGYFCDRDTETDELMQAALNGRNVTLYALRRMGKTGLIHNASYKLKRKHKWLTLYSDLFSTESEVDLIESLTNSALQQLASKRNILNQIQDAFGSLAPSISFDPISGAPKVKLRIESEREVMHSLEELFGYVESFGKPIYWAWDEFQQIATYDQNQKILKKIRGLVQSSHNIQFVFSGSHMGMLLSIFEDSKAAFYKSTQILHLEEIDEKKYSSFIQKKYSDYNKNCTESEASHILHTCKTHTWYVQFLCNRLFQNHDTLSTEIIDMTLRDILREQELGYYRLRSILTAGQWNLLRAIGLEEEVRHITGKDFIHKHNLKSSAAVLRSLDKLIEDELVVKTDNPKSNLYRVVDVFLLRWLQWKYGV